MAANSSDSDIRAAIYLLGDSKLKRDAEEILCDPSKKVVYDKAHNLLVDIAVLRASLGLNYSNNWDGDEANDYPVTNCFSKSKLQEFIEKSHYDPITTKRYSIYQVIKKSRGSIIFLIIIISIFTLLLFNSNYFKSSITSTSNDKPIEKFIEPEQQLPENGHVERYIKKKRIAPLEIRASASHHSLVKLEDAKSGDDILSIFVRKGEIANVKVPLGDYIIEYASGEKWYGYLYRFGPETYYERASDVFYFTKDGRKVNGYTITLYEVINGNLKTQNINADDF